MLQTRPLKQLIATQRLVTLTPLGVIDGLEKDWADHLLDYHGVRSPPHIGRNPYVIHSIAGVAEIRSVALLSSDALGGATASAVECAGNN